MNKKVAEHKFLFNPKDNGGESLTLKTEVFDNGDKFDNLYFNQTLCLQSYCNSAQFNLGTAKLSPNNLRELANQLDALLAGIK